MAGGDGRFRLGGAFRAAAAKAGHGLAVAGGLAAPLAEEVYFRGVLFRFLRTRGFLFALVVSTTVFAGAHMLFSGRSLPLTQIAGGILFAWSFEKEKSLWVPMVIHSTGNIALFTLSLL